MEDKEEILVGIYARISTNEDKQTTENQLLELRQFCRRKGYTIYKEYIDHQSGSKASRANFLALLDDARKRKIDVVLCWALDRFTREGALKTMLYLQQLNECRAGFVSYTEQYLDTTGIFKDAIISILATMAKQERVRISERVKAGLSRAKAQGRVGGRPSRVDATLLAKMIELKETGMSNRKIAKQLEVNHATVNKFLKEQGEGNNETE
jgi:DNA invertase Pin-like site-specific DNA recombinase